MIGRKFVVAIEGDWNYNGRAVTIAIIERELRETVKDRFEFLAEKITVVRAADAAETRDAKGGEHA